VNKANCCPGPPNEDIGLSPGSRFKELLWLWKFPSCGIVAVLLYDDAKGVSCSSDTQISSRRKS